MRVFSILLVVCLGCGSPDSSQGNDSRQARNAAETSQASALVAREPYKDLIASVKAERRQLFVVVNAGFKTLSNEERLKIIQSLREIWTKTADKTKPRPPWLTVQDEAGEYIGGYDETKGVWAND